MKITKSQIRYPPQTFKCVWVTKYKQNKSLLFSIYKLNWQSLLIEGKHHKYKDGLLHIHRGRGNIDFIAKVNKDNIFYN